MTKKIVIKFGKPDNTRIETEDGDLLLISSVNINADANKNDQMPHVTLGVCLPLIDECVVDARDVVILDLDGHIKTWDALGYELRRKDAGDSVVDAIKSLTKALTTKRMIVE